MADPTYKADISIQQRHESRYRKRKRAALSAIFIVLCLIIALAYNIYHLNNKDNKKVIGAAYEKSIAGPQIYKSSFFQFSDSNKWVYAPNDSTSNKITFLQYQGGVLAYSLTVYVNQSPLQSDLAVTYVLPVTIINNNSFSVGTVSDMCGKLYKATDLKRIKEINIDGTSMLCVPDSPQYDVIAGQLGGDYDLKLRRSSGEVADYIIIYQDLTVSPTPDPFLNVMKTFRAL